MQMGHGTLQLLRQLLETIVHFMTLNEPSGIALPFLSRSSQAIREHSDDNSEAIYCFGKALSRRIVSRLGVRHPNRVLHKETFVA